MGQYQTFIVRIWTDGAPSSTRGHIQHIASRRGRYFRDEERMVRFIREFLDTAALPAGDGIDRSVPDEPAEESDRGSEDKGAVGQ